MGRTIPTYRLHLESILNDWMDYRRALREKDREVFDRLLNKSRQHSSAASYCAHIDPSILALLSVLLEMERDIETLKRERSSAARDSGRRAEGQRSVDAFVRVPRVRAGRPSGPVAVVPLARALGPDADALGSPRGPPHAHFHRPPSRVASRGPPGLVMAGELAHARLDHRRLRGLRPRLDGPLALERAGGASDRGPEGRADVLLA